MSTVHVSFQIPPNPNSMQSDLILLSQKALEKRDKNVPHLPLKCKLHMNKPMLQSVTVLGADVNVTDWVAG